MVHLIVTKDKINDPKLTERAKIMEAYEKKYAEIGQNLKLNFSEIKIEDILAIALVVDIPEKDVQEVKNYCEKSNLIITGDKSRDGILFLK